MNIKEDEVWKELEGESADQEEEKFDESEIEEL